jgi:hypothetical protein
MSGFAVMSLPWLYAEIMLEHLRGIEMTRKMLQNVSDITADEPSQQLLIDDDPDDTTKQ